MPAMIADGPMLRSARQEIFRPLERVLSPASHGARGAEPAQGIQSRPARVFVPEARGKALQRGDLLATRSAAPVIESVTALSQQAFGFVQSSPRTRITRVPLLDGDLDRLR